MMKNRYIIIAVIIGIILVGVAIMGPIMSDVERPNYEVVESSGDIQIRRYEPMIIAEVEVKGQRKEAIGEGFRLLADYIFGNNKAMNIEMEQNKNIKIAMTAPVQQQLIGERWKISFIMPAEYTLKTLPIPRDKQVVIKEMPAKEFVVIRFSGTSSDDNLQKYTDKLMAYISSKNLSVIGSPKYAFYNPPWTLPAMRHNEILIEIKPYKTLKD